MTHIIPRVLCVAAGMDDQFRIFGNDFKTDDGTCYRDFIHVVDLVDAHLLGADMLMKPGKTMELYNLGNGNGFSVLQVLKAGEAVTGKTIKHSIVARRGGDPDTLIASSAKAKHELG